MECPSCDDQDLDERQSHGIEVDVCPKCSGVWLDRGEMEKLAGTSSQERSIDTGDLTLLASGARDDAQDGAVRREAHDDHDDDDDGKRSSSKQRKKRKDSRWEELADLLEDLFEDILDFD